MKTVEQWEKDLRDRSVRDLEAKVGHGLAVELGVLASLLVIVVLLFTSKLAPPPPAPSVDATCVLPAMARASAAGEPVAHALSACSVTRTEAMRVWEAHLEAERIEGVVPRRTE